MKDYSNPKPAQPKPLQPKAPEPDKESKVRQPQMQDWPSSLDELFLFDPNFESCW